MYDAVIFDKDGVLLDSMSGGFRWADNARAVLAEELGADLSADEASKIVREQKLDELDAFLKETGLNFHQLKEIERFIAEKKIKRIKNGDIELFPGTEPVLESINAPKAVVSNAPYKVTRFTVEYFDIAGHFDALEAPSLECFRTYVRKKKPNTEMVSKAMRELECRNPLFVGDTSDDILVAKNAGIDVCLVNGYKDYSELQPDYTFDSLKGVLEALDSDLKISAQH